ncbi:MAG: hypothetical protein KDK38_04975 [Leptospiraceae bacterium]|nr:hypothetical protein [Leptospiraceae bacterium]
MKVIYFIELQFREAKVYVEIKERSKTVKRKKIYMIILIVLLTTQNCVWIKLKTELQTVSSQLIHEKTEQIQNISYVALKECQSGFPTCRLIVEQHTSAAKVLVKSFQETVRSVREFPENFEYYHFHIGWLKERTGWLGYTGHIAAGIFLTLGTNLLVASADFVSLPFRLIDTVSERIREEKIILEETITRAPVNGGLLKVGTQNFVFAGSSTKVPARVLQESTALPVIEYYTSGSAKPLKLTLKSI